MSPRATDEKIARMLLWFEAQLPPHELGYWYITRESTPVAIVNDEPPNVIRGLGGWPASWNIQIRGYGQCVRCGKQFDIPGWGNFTTSEDRIEATVQKAKEWVERDAAQDGPCWGDIPRVAEDHGWAVADAVPQ